MKSAILTLLAFLAYASALAEAQDIVTMKNGDIVTAKVLEIDDEDVKYRFFDEPDGVVYSVPRREILSIRYESGREETFQRDTAGNLFADRDITATTEQQPAGVSTGARYRDYRGLYRASDYIWEPGDKYIPALSGVASFVIPGLGQMLCGEVGRGIAFFGLTVGLPVAATLIAVSCSSYAAMASCMAAGIIGCVAIDIWNIVDAVQVAKIKNMYMHDAKREYSFALDIFPSVNCIPASSGMQASPGLTLAVRF